jgi:hypothetical protein
VQVEINVRNEGQIQMFSRSTDKAVG